MMATPGLATQGSIPVSKLGLTNAAWRRSKERSMANETRIDRINLGGKVMYQLLRFSSTVISAWSGGSNRIEYFQRPSSRQVGGDRFPGNEVGRGINDHGLIRCGIGDHKAQD